MRSFLHNFGCFLKMKISNYSFAAAGASSHELHRARQHNVGGATCWHSRDVGWCRKTKFRPMSLSTHFGAGAGDHGRTAGGDQNTV